jgi:predicted signal transduction protein with EAL and GGDEF domain
MVASALIVAGALGAVLVVTLDAVSRQSRARATTELEVARTAFYKQLEMRKASTAAALHLVTELPVFRAHLVDARLATDQDTIDAMADGYRGELGAQFMLVTNASGAWLASPGWQPDRPLRQVPGGLEPLVTQAQAGRTASAVVPRGDELYLAVAVPARFAEETLGTVTVGYRITDELATELARLARCEVVVLAGDRVAASSLGASRESEARRLAAQVSVGPSGVRNGLVSLPDRQFVAGAFALEPKGESLDAGRLVLLSDWQPTREFVAQLRSRFLAGGLVVFVLALGGGLIFSRSVSRPLRDIADAAERIADGDLTLELPVRGSAEAVTVALAFNDMSSGLREARDRLVHDAIHDQLTRLPNRVLLMERLERALARRARHPEYRFALLFIDLDRFKYVNDSLGHSAGDSLLVSFAERLVRVVRRDDVVTRVVTSDVPEPEPNTLARFGGDEFVILLDDIREPIDAIRVAERVQRELRVPFRVADQDVFTTASVGVAVSSAVHRTAGEVVRDADLAMYRAKDAGGASYAVFDDTMHEQAVERFRLETEIRQAMERKEFCLWYQPIVSLDTHVVSGYEALIRWRHPERGILVPAAFLGAAEQMGLMPAIDEWGLREACRQARAWQLERPERPPFSVSVNLSAKAFGIPSLVSLVADVLHETNLPPHMLRLEITEGVAIADPERTASILADLRRLGVRVSLDDFGTGYCSLSYLQQLPVDTLKIDRSFVSRIGTGPSEIIQLIVGLAKTLNLDVVAEGAETAEQVAYLDQLGCGFGQGFYFAQPLAPAQVSVAPVTSGAVPPVPVLS